MGVERSIQRLPDRAREPAALPVDVEDEHGARDGAGAAPGTGLVVKALNLIDLIAAEPGQHRAQTLADELGLPRSTVYRIIHTLQQRGMVRVEPVQPGLLPRLQVPGIRPGGLARAGPADARHGGDALAARPDRRNRLLRRAGGR